VYETGNDVRIFEVVIVVRTENVCWDCRSEVAAKLFVVSAVSPLSTMSLLPVKQELTEEEEHTGCRHLRVVFRERTQSLTREGDRGERVIHRLGT